MSVTAESNGKATKEAFLLRQEVQQLRQRMADEANSAKEVAEKLRAEVESLRASQARADRAHQAESRQGREEVDVLRAQVADLRTQERQLQEQLLQRDALADANAQLSCENERLRQRIARLQQTGGSPSGGGSQTVRQPRVPRLQPLNDGLARLAELSASLDRTLAED